ncbi:MAG: glycosyltransferase [Pseudomonadota bacterium]
MRILVFGNLTPYVPGGAERQVRLLVEGWARLGHQVTVAGSCLPDTAITVDGATIRLCRAPVRGGLGRAGRALSYFLSVCRVLFRQRGRYDVIYCRFLTDSACSVALLKQLRLVRRPLVACPASSGPGGDAEFIRRFPGSRALVALLSAQCDAINLISPGIAEEIKSLAIRPGRWSHIHNGVVQAPAPAPLSDGKPLQLLFIGGLRRQKGVDLLLDAVAAARGQGAALVLDLVGDGPDRERLQDQARRLGIAAHVRFHGVLEAADVAMRIRQAHVLVLPSRWEGMANVALEALALGRPVIVSRCGGIDRFITPACGWTVAIDAAPALTTALVAAATLPRDRLAAMGQAGFELIQREFSLERAVQAHLELFAAVQGPATA